MRFIIKNMKPSIVSILTVLLIFAATMPAIAAKVAGVEQTVPAMTTSTVSPAKALQKEEPAEAVDVPETKAKFQQTDDVSSGHKVSVKTKKKKLPKYVTLDFDNVDIDVFVKFVSELTGRNFILDDKVKGKITIISPKKIPLDDVYKVFLSVLEVHGYATVPAGDMIKIVPSMLAREKSLETRSKKDVAGSDDRLVTQIISLERANPDEVKRILDPIISKTSSVLSYPPAGILVITDYLSNIKRLQEIIKSLDVEGAGDQITYIPLQNASASEVVKSLTNIFQQRRANTTAIRIVPDPRTNSIIILASVADTESLRKLIALMDKDVPRGESNLQVYRLQNSNADDLAKVLTSIIQGTSNAAAATTGAAATAAATQRIASPVVSKNVQVVSDKATNTLIVMAEREDYKILEDIIKKLDVPRPMVYIEALIMEVNANKDFQLGVEWRGIKDTGSIDGMAGTGSVAFIGSGTNLLPSATIANGIASLALPSGFSMGIIGAGITIGNVLFPTIGAVVQAYKNDADVSILSTPQLMTLDNEEAEINVGSNVPYITRQDSTSSTTVNTVNYNSFEYKDVGVILNITPHINEENFVRLKISQQVTKVTSGTSTTPTTLKRTAKTTVVVKDKETIVIGGLVGDSTEETVTKVPLLGDIPLLGWLFKSKKVTREKTNLYVFLTPQIVRTQKEARNLFEEKRETMGNVVEGVIKLDQKRQDPTSLVEPVPAGNKTSVKP